MPAQTNVVPLLLSIILVLRHRDCAPFPTSPTFESKVQHDGGLEEIFNNLEEETPGGKDINNLNVVLNRTEEHDFSLLNNDRHKSVTVPKPDIDEYAFRTNYIPGLGPGASFGAKFGDLSRNLNLLGGYQEGAGWHGDIGGQLGKFTGGASWDKQAGVGGRVGLGSDEHSRFKYGAEATYNKQDGVGAKLGMGNNENSRIKWNVGATWNPHNGPGAQFGVKIPL